MPSVRLYFPYIESGQVSVGYSTVDIVDHVAEIDGAEAEIITYWQQTASAFIIPGTPSATNIEPPDELEIGVG